MLSRHHPHRRADRSARPPEESGETVNSESDGRAEWLCPLCQKGQTDRSSLSLHLTEQHSVLPSCVDRLLDIAVLKQGASGGGEDRGAHKSSDAESSQLKPTEDVRSEACQSSESSDATQTLGNKEMEEERIMEQEGGEAEPEPEEEGNQLTGAKQQNATENTEIPDASEKTALSVHYNSASHIQRMTTGSAKPGGDSDPQTPPVPVLSRPYKSHKPYQCAVCRVSYNHAITLESHMKSVLHQTRSRNAGIVAQAANNAAASAGLGGSAATTPNTVVSTPAVSAFLTLLTSSPNTFSHSLLPSLFAPGAASGAAVHQLVPQPQMVMPLILNGLQAQTQQHQENQQGQPLAQCVPFVGLSTAQQALLTQRLNSLQSQWPSAGVPTNMQPSLEEQKQTIKCEREQERQDSEETAEKALAQIKDEDNGMTEKVKEEDSKEFTLCPDVESKVKSENNEDNGKAHRDSTTDGDRSANQLDLEGDKAASQNLSPAGTEKSLRNNNLSPSASVPSNSTLSPSRSEADAASPPHEDCEALGREVGLSEDEVRRWLSRARHAKQRQRATELDHLQGFAGFTRHALSSDNDYDDEESSLIIAEGEDDAEASGKDEYEDEEGGGGQRTKRKKRKGEFERDEVEVKKERQDPDVDLELEAQGDPPVTQPLCPLSYPSMVGDVSKVPMFPNPPTITRFSNSLLSQSLSSHNQASHYLSNGGDCEAALDLSMGKNSSKSASSTSSLADKIAAQKGQLLDGLGLRPTSKGLVVVQVKPESVTTMPSSNSSMSLVNCNNMTKSSIYMRAAEKINSTLLEREQEKEREKEKEREQDQQQRKSKAKRYRDMRRSRTIIQAEQLDILYGCYFKDPNPGKHEFEQISEWVHLPKKVVQIWFQNMRARERKGEVRFISDGTLAAVGKPLIKFTWPLLSVSSSASAVPKTKLETTSNVTMVKVAPKVNTPVLLAPPKDPIPIAPRPAQKRKLQEDSEEDKTDEERDNENEMGPGPGITNRMVPKLPTTPINNRPPATTVVPQKQNGLNYWTPKVPIKINTLSREQLALPTHTAPRTIPLLPLPALHQLAPTPSSAKVASPSTPAVVKSSPSESSFLPHSSSRRPRTHLSCLQLSILQSCYETCAHPNAMECEAIGSELNLPLKSPLSGGKVDMSSGSYLQYNALKANRPILPKPVQLTVTEPPASPVAGQPVPKETLTGRCDACNVSFESRAAARAHVFSPRHLATLRTTNFGQPTTLVNKNGTGNGGPGSAVSGSQVSHSTTVTSSSAGPGGEMVMESPPPTATSSS
ncbi:hypothetical protein INR49_021171 [Caranx melampygus]|nr:hypothetical protein INR49_021171 [Caranx melampygus]